MIANINEISYMVTDSWQQMKRILTPLIHLQWKSLVRIGCDVIS